MSSLGISLLLLLIVAIAVAIGYNLRQGAWPRWEQAFRRLAGDVRARGASARADALRRKDAPPSNGRRSSERGEPRLGGGGTPVPPADGNDEGDEAAFDATFGQAAPASGLDASGALRQELASGAPSAFDDTGLYADEDLAQAGGNPAPATTSASAADGAPAAVPARPPAARPDPTPETGSEPPASLAAGAGLAMPATPVPDVPAASPTDSSAAAPVAADADDRGAVAASAATPAAATRTGPAAGGPSLSEASDCIVELALPTPLAGERLLAIAQRFRRSGSKPVAFDGQPRPAAEGFESPVAGRNYELIRVGILLANRHGPLNAMEFSEFVSAVQAMAETLSARAQMPAMGSVLARARDLDSTCAQLDVQIGVNVETPEAVDPAQLASLAQTLGLVERGSHRYVRQGPQGEPLFSLGFSDSPSRLTFLLDVPRVAASLEPFGRMVQSADACAQRLGAQLVDDSGKPLTQASLAQIARQLEQRYESLEAIGLPAGSTLACKVFN